MRVSSYYTFKYLSSKARCEMQLICMQTNVVVLSKSIVHIQFNLIHLYGFAFVVPGHCYNLKSCQKLALSLGYSILSVLFTMKQICIFPAD